MSPGICGKLRDRAFPRDAILVHSPGKVLTRTKMSNIAVVPATLLQVGLQLKKNVYSLFPMSLDPKNPRPTRPPDNLEREESQLWRWALGFMVLLSVALAALLWERLENIPYHLRLIPLGLLLLSVLFAVYAAGRRREVNELKIGRASCRER